MYKPGTINILKEPPEIEEDPDILTEDVVQGELGDCYFLSAISALAEIPERIKMLFPRLDFSPVGAFEVIIYLHGEPVRVVVDDYFPFVQIGDSEPQLAFVGINERSKNIWPMILEKVWAKLNLSYEDIISGHSGEAFEFLSPAPIETYYHDVHADHLFEEIKDADDKDYIICTDITMTENTNSAFLAKLGLVSNHSYTIIDVAEITDNLGKKIRLLKIRNPWGGNEWTGDWSDKSSKWTPEIKKLLNFNDEDDGTFWMCYEDFCRFYTSTHVCRVHPDFNFISKRFPYNKELPFNLVRVDVPKDSTGYFIVNQKNARVYKNAKGLDNFENKYCSVVVFKEVDGDYIYVGANCGRQNRVFVECKEMLKGTYYIAVSFPVRSECLSSEDKLKHGHSHAHDHSHATSFDNITYRIGIYSPFEKLNIYDLQGNEEMQKMKDFLKDVVFDLAADDPNIYYFEEEGEKTTWRSISFEQDAGAYGYICYENNSDAFIHEHLTFTKFYNLNLIPILEDGDIATLDVEHESSIEDEHERNAVDAMKAQTDVKSSVKVINVVDHHEDVTPDNPIELIVKVAPRSRALVLIEKLDEDAAIEVNSRIALSYPTLRLLDRTKFPAKKNRVRYNGKPVEIYECVVEHSTGVIIFYKNKTPDLKFVCHVSFPEMNNLKITRRPEDFMKDFQKKKSEVNDYSSYDPTALEFEIEDENKEIVLSLEPGTTRIFELSSLDVFESYSYSCTMDYHINIAKTKKSSK